MPRRVIRGAVKKFLARLTKLYHTTKQLFTGTCCACCVT